MQTIRMEQVKLMGKEQRQGSYTQGKNPQNETEHTVQILITIPLDMTYTIISTVVCLSLVCWIAPISPVSR